MEGILKIKNTTIYTRYVSLDYESRLGNGNVEWEEIKDRNGKLVDIIPISRGADIPRYAEKEYDRLVKEKQAELKRGLNLC